MNPPISEITLRDYFATAAMQAAMNTTKTKFEEDALHIVVRYAYLVADAMMKARNV
jgi:hypothetical protein